MIWQSDIADEIEKARWYAQEPERFVPCANGWWLEGNHHRHFVQFVDDVLQCSCETWRRKAEVGQTWCEHTRAVEILLKEGKLERPVPIAFATVEPLHAFVLPIT